jgi:oligopeptidase B
MLPQRTLSLLLALLLTSCAPAQIQERQSPPSVAAPQPPAARMVARVDTLHGTELIDHYFWLRELENPDVIAYLEAENAYADRMMKPTGALQETLYQEMLGRIQETDLSVPERVGPFFYYTRTEEGKQYPVYARKRGSLDAPEEVIFDQNAMAEGHAFYQIGAFQVSPDHNLLAVAVDTTGAERPVLMVRDLRTGQWQPDRIPNVGSVAWASDNRTLFYTIYDEARRPFQVLRHRLGTPAAQDPLLHHETDESMFVDVGRTKDDRFLLLSAGSFTTAEVRYLDATRPEGEFQVLRPRTPGVLYTAEHRGDQFLIVTNEGAENFKLMQVSDSSPSAAWRELVPHRPDVLLDGIDVFRDHLALYERQNGLRQIRVMEMATGTSNVIDFPEAVYTLSGARNPEFDTDTLRFTYQSLVSPPAVFDYDMSTQERTLRKETPVPGYDPARYTSERVWATAEDGTRIPLSLVYRKGLAKNGNNPTLLYGYGAYGISTDPTFSVLLPSLLDRGFVYAIAHVRGGQEMGRRWYDEGKLRNKRNSFTDFIAAAEHLVREGYTRPEKLAIHGGSAGGLLVGAVTNLRPDLFQTVVASVPFVDVINTMLDPTIPLTVIEWEQWGNPQNPDDYAYIASYSPYENVKRTAYPNMLVTAGLNDPRVGYWEPAKWVAKLRTHDTDPDNLILLKTNMGAGHGGASGRYDRLKEAAFRYAFVLHTLGVRE